jgi:hypothetical protein
MRVLLVLAALWVAAACSPSESQAPSAMPAPATPVAEEPAPVATTPATEQHTLLAQTALRSAYAVAGATNDCPLLTTDLHGWPAARVRHCVYSLNDAGLGAPREAVAYILDVSPDRIARWIETACALVDTDAERCFTRVLETGRLNSSYMFVVAGNMLEDMYERRHYRNYIFRHGMTTSFRRGVNDRADVLELADQETLAAAPDSAAIAVPSGSTRFWGTTPANFAARFPDAGAPPDSTGANRAAWLALARTEMLAALESDRNRLLEAWLCAHAVQMFAKPCAPNASP